MGRSPPICSKREAISSWPHTPLSDLGDQAPRSALRKGYSETCSLICLVGWLPPFGSVSRSATRGHERWRFERVKASKTFCVLVVCTDPHKVIRASKEPIAMRFTVQPNG